MMSALTSLHRLERHRLSSMLLLALVAHHLAARPARATVYDYTAGHADIGLAYDAGTGPRFFLQFGGDAEATGLTNEQLVAGQPGGVLGEWPLASFVTVVPQSVQISRPAGAEWDFLGTAAGDPVWIFSQQSQAGVPFLGFDTAKAGGGTGTYTLSNVTVRPTGGEVSLFQIGGFGTPDAVYWSTVEAGVDAVTVPASTHVHYAFGFTEPGYYELPLIGTGGGFPGQATGTLAFQVSPGAGPTSIVIDVPGGSLTQGQAGYPTIAAATSLTKTGAGTLVFDAANAYSGPTTVSGGTLQLANAAAVAATNVTVDTGATLAVSPGTTPRAPAVIIDGGTLSAATVAVNSSTGIASLAINAGTISGSPGVTITSGGQMSLAQDARVSVGIGGLAVDQAGGGGRLDLGAGQVVVAAGGITAAELRADIIAGRNGGAWNGVAGITSSTAAAAGGNRAVGYVVAGDGSARVSFAAPGDTDLSGQVNILDLIGIDSAGMFGTGQAADWSQGDFNYDGVVNILDLIGIDSSGAYGTGNYFPASPTSVSGSVAAVPEPAGLGAVTFVAAAALASRRRFVQKSVSYPGISSV